MKMKRFLAIVILLILVISLIGTIYVAIFTSNIRLLFVFLFIDIVIPVVIYAYLIITKHIRNLNKRDDNK